MEGLCCSNGIEQNPETWFVPARRYLQWMNRATPREPIIARPAGDGSARSTPTTKHGIIALSARVTRAARDKRGSVSPVSRLDSDLVIHDLPGIVAPRYFSVVRTKPGLAEIGFAPIRLPNCRRTERTTFSDRAARVWIYPASVHIPLQNGKPLSP